MATNSEEILLAWLRHEHRLSSFSRSSGGKVTVDEGALLRLLLSLQELLEAELSVMPPYEAGREAQDSWADRRAAARNNAAAILRHKPTAKYQETVT